MVEFLNTTFSGFDGGIFSAMNKLAVSAGGFFTPLFKIVSLLGEKGLIFILAGLVLLCFAKTRKIGVCMIGAIAIGAIITNLTLKEIIARPRPFNSSTTYNDFWQTVGAPPEDSYSFPSGHTTSTMAFATAMFLTCNKKWSWVGFLGALLMGVSRIYLIAHYPTDVIGGLIVGGIAGVCAFFITKLIYKIADKNKDKKFFKFVLEFDLLNAFKKNKPIEQTQTEKSENQELTENVEQTENQENE